MELKEGGLQELRDRLGHHAGLRESFREHQQHSSGARSGRFYGFSLLASFLNPLAFGKKTGRNQAESSLPTTNLPAAMVLPSGTPPQTQHTCPAHLLICTRTDTYGAKVHHETVNDLQYDRIFFMRLRQAYERLRGKILSRFSLRTVSGIYFVRV